MLTRILCGIAVAALGVALAQADETTAKRAKVTVVFDHVLPNAAGKSMKGVLVEYAPGGGSPAHTHPKSAFIYATVLEGTVRSQINDGPATVYRAGEHFYEMPGDHHAISENASETEPARLLAVFVVDTSETKLVFDDPQ